MGTALRPAAAGLPVALVPDAAARAVYASLSALGSANMTTMRVRCDNPGCQPRHPRRLEMGLAHMPGRMVVGRQ